MTNISGRALRAVGVKSFHSRVTRVECGGEREKSSTRQSPGSRLCLSAASQSAIGNVSRFTQKKKKEERK